jgi:hypothetical protein
VKTKNLNILISVLAAGLLIGGGFLVHQHIQIKSLHDQLAVHTAHILQIDQAIKLDKRKRLSGNRTTPDSLRPGIYTLELDFVDEQHNFGQDPYTIYHVTSTVSAGDLKMHFGIAPAKLRFYFDQDNDGWVDTESIYEYMDSIPFVGRLLSKTVEPELSQELYNTFLTHSDKAKFITPEHIKEDAEKAVQDLWSWATSTFEEISDRIME